MGRDADGYNPTVGQTRDLNLYHNETNAIGTTVVIL
jgi:hypothetical protein